jgi:hypothetical protein
MGGAGTGMIADWRRKDHDSDLGGSNSSNGVAGSDGDNLATSGRTGGGGFTGAEMAAGSATRATGERSTDWAHNQPTTTITPLKSINQPRIGATIHSGNVPRWQSIIGGIRDGCFARMPGTGKRTVLGTSHRGQQSGRSSSVLVVNSRPHRQVMVKIMTRTHTERNDDYILMATRSCSKRPR